MSQELECVTASPEETQRVGRLLGEGCAGGELILLAGPLGSGKTCFVQGLALGLDVRDYVHSPTFVMVSRYRGRKPLCHIDLYRVESEAEAEDLGLDEYFASQDICAVEWAERAMDALPREHLLVTLAHLGGDQRRVHLRATARRYEALLRRLVPLATVRR